MIANQFVTDPLLLWPASRVLSLMRSGGSETAINEFLQSRQPGAWQVQVYRADSIPLQVAICSTVGFNLFCLGGVRTRADAEAFSQVFFRRPSLQPQPGYNPLVLSIGDVYVPMFMPIMTANPGENVFAGHSMGGLVAMYLSWYFQSNIPTQVHKVITFGAPRGAGVEVMPAAARLTGFRVVNEGDPIPFVYPYSTEAATNYNLWRLASQQSDNNLWLHYYRGGRLSASGLDYSEGLPDLAKANIPTSFTGWATGLMQYPIDEHAISTYEARLAALVASPTTEPSTPPVDQIDNGGGHGSPLPAPPPSVPTLQALVPDWVPPTPPPIPAGVESLKPFWAKKLGKEWWVMHWNDPLFRTKGRSIAKRSASRLNSLSLAWCNSTMGNQDDLLTAVQAEFPAE